MTPNRIATALALGLALAVIALPAGAFRYADIGNELPNATLKALDGKQRQILDPEAPLNVFMFFRPNQPRSLEALTILTRVCENYADRKVNCVALVSDYYKRKEVLKAIKHADWSAARTLVDHDELYAGRLGVSLHPSIGIANGACELLAYEPYAHVNYTQRIEAQIEYALGEINLEQLRAALDPPVLPKKHKDRAHLNYHYALKLYDSGKLDRALETAKQALEIDDTLVDAYALIGLVYLRKSDCNKAKQHFEMALSRDPDNAAAKQGKQICK